MKGSKAIEDPKKVVPEKGKKNQTKADKKGAAAQQKNSIQFNENDYESDNLYDEDNLFDDMDDGSDDDGSSEEDLYAVGLKRGFPTDKKSSEESEPNYKRQKKY